MIEQHNKLLTELVMLDKNGKRGIIHSGIPSPDMKQFPIVPLGNEPHYRNKTPTSSPYTSLKTDTINVHQLKSQPKFPSKDK